MKWVYKGGSWEALPSPTPPEQQTPPPNSTHGAWSSNGNLIIVQLMTDDGLRLDADRRYSFERNNKQHAIDDQYIPVHALPTIPIHFLRIEKQLRMVLSEGRDNALSQLAQTTRCSKICLQIGTVTSCFSLDAVQHWVSVVDWTAESLPLEIGIQSIENHLHVPVSWKWKARSLRLVDSGGNTLHMRAMSASPETIVRIAFNTPAPPRLKFAGRWSLIPIPANSSAEFVAAIKDGDREMSCREFLSVYSENRFSFSAPEYTPEVDTTDWIPKETRCFAILNSQGLPESKQGSTENCFSFGPSRPYVIGSGESPGGVYIWNKTRFDTHAKGKLSNGALPKPPAPASELILFIRQELAEKVVVGMLKVATDIPVGGWISRRHLGVGDRIVSWNGFIDQVTVSTINWMGSQRPIVTFKNGFELKPEFWFAAPFLGVAKTRDSDWWGDARNSGMAKLVRQKSKFVQVKGAEEWGVEGRWVDIMERAAFDRFGGFLGEASTKLVLFNGKDSSKSSGPILEVELDKKWPKVVGWLASTTGDAELSFGHVSLGSETEGPVTLETDEDIEAKQTSERIRRAFRVARNDPRGMEGVIDGVYWRRESNGMIKAQELESNAGGIYVLENAQ